MLSSSLWTSGSIALYFLLLGLWGIALLRRLELPGQTWLTLLPLSLVAALAVQMLLANAASYAVAPPLSFPVAWALQLAALALVRRRPAREPEPAPRACLALLAGLGLATAVGFGTQAFSEFQFDNFKQHWLNVATILEGNFPVRHALQPDEPIRYHYGSYLISAQLLWISGAPVFLAPQLVKVACVTAFLLLVFGWVAERRGGAGLALLAFSTAAFYVGLPEVLAELGSARSPGEWLERSLVHAQQNEYFHFPSAALFVLPVAPGWTFAAAALHLLWRRGLGIDGISGALLVALLAALALSATPEFVLLWGGIALYLGLRELRLLREPGRAARARLWLCLAASLAIACVQGGIASDLIFHPAPDAPPEYTLRWPPGMARIGAWSEVYRIGSSAWLAELVVGSDGLVLLVPVAAVAALRRYSPAKGLWLCAIAGGLLLSHLLEYTPAPFNTNRFLAFALELNLLLLFLVWAEARAAGALRSAPARAAAALFTAVALAGSLPAMAYQLRLLGGGSPGSGPSYLAWWDDPELLSAASWIRGLAPPGALVASNEPALLVATTGRFSPSGAVVTHGHARGGGLGDDYSTWSADAVEASRAGFLCVFRSPYFQAGDLDAAALPRDLSRPGANLDRLREVLAADVPLLRSGPEGAAAALNRIVGWRHRFAADLDPAELALPPGTRARLARRLAAPAAWMYWNRALLQALLPDATRASHRRSEEIDDAHLSHYAWVRELERRRGPLAWRAPPFAPERVRCLALERSAGSG